MPVLPEEWDPESKGSRFTTRPALVVIVGEVPEGELPSEPPGAAAARVIEDRLGDWILGDQGDLGTPRVVDGSIGRGADAWAPVLEWVFQPAIAGVVGAAAWEATKAASRGARRIIDRLKREGGHRIYVSRGMAALLAVQDVLDSYPDARLAIEAVEEPSSIAGHSSMELNYVGIEPWIVLLVDPHEEKRYVVAVASNGKVKASMELEYEEFESFYPTIRPFK
jgi:hypothetical protein